MIEAFPCYCKPEREARMVMPAISHAEVNRILLLARNAHRLGNYWQIHVGATNLALGLAFHLSNERPALTAPREASK